MNTLSLTHCTGRTESAKVWIFVSQKVENSLAANLKNSDNFIQIGRTGDRWLTDDKKGRREPFSVLFNCATAGSRSARSYAANIDHDDVSVHSRARPLPQDFHAPNFFAPPAPSSFIRLIISKKVT
jgi:hypothetical protein